MESLPHLPEELVILILARLPPASALRFQNVCKSWRSIVSVPGFLERSILLRCKRRETSLVIVDPRRDYNVGSLVEPSYTILESPTSLSPTEFGQLPPPPLNRVFWSNFVVMVGSCRGVVYLTEDSGHCVLWNPTTGESRDLQDHDREVQVQSFNNIGLGHFDGDFKVVKLSKTCRNYKEQICVRAKIYKLNLGYWREISTIGIDKNGIGLPYSSYPSMVCWRDGKMCSWITKFVRDNKTMTYSFIITSFDMSNDTFTSFSSAKVPHDYNSIGLLTLNDLLAFWCSCPSLRHQRDRTNKDIWVVDIWVMLQHGVVESWAKLWSIRVGPEPHWPKVIWNGGLFMKKSSEDRLLWCDLSNSSLIIHTLPGFASTRCPWTGTPEVVTFEKSRASLDSDRP